MKVMGATLLATILCVPVYAAEAPQAKPAPVKADTLFNQADKNHDGKLDPQEFEVYKKLQEERLIAQIKQRIDSMQFSSFDKDGDKFITKDELKAARMEAQQKMMQNIRNRQQLQIKSVTSTPAAAPAATDSSKK